MSGGHWNYLHVQIMEAGEDLLGPEYTSETQAKIRLAGETLILAAKMMKRVDWLFSGDDGEDTFNERWIDQGLPVPESEARDD